MANRNPSAFDDLCAELDKDPEFVAEYERQKPYYDLLLAIIKRRKQLNLTQAELAARANTHQSRVSRIESGEHDIRLSTLIAVAEALYTKVKIQLEPTAYYFDGADYRKLFNISANNAPGQEVNSTVIETAFKV
jgi:transcriptional regulator with XRE-family HTH domain